jgi:hypothetical protein
VPVIPALRKQREKEHEASLDYFERCCLNYPQIINKYLSTNNEM